MNSKNCSLHQNPVEYFCEKCYEPVCKQCTMTGPHNTPIHSITNIADAYQRRVNEIQQRISAFLQNKQTIQSSIYILNNDIEKLKQLREQSIDENEKYRSQMVQQLQKQYDRIKNQLMLISEQFQQKMNQINDLGHAFEQMNDEIQILASHSTILHSMKQCLDRLTILLQKNQLFPELPKELSDLRLDLKNIQTYQTLINQKVKIIQQIFKMLETQKRKIQKPTIDYQLLLKQLNENMNQCVFHNVCHYCGLIFTNQIVNKPCQKNNSSLDFNSFVGFCQKKPDSLRWSTHRHFFGPPLNKYQYYRTTQVNSFSIHLNSLLLKLKTICNIKKINLHKQFKIADKSKSGTCNRIQMTYILMQSCDLTQDEKQIMLSICDQPSKDIFTYDSILCALRKIQIDETDKLVNNNEIFMNIADTFKGLS